MNPKFSRISQKKLLFIVGFIVLVSALTYGTVFSYTTYKKLKETQQELVITTESFNTQVTELQTQVETLTKENENITSFLTDEQQKNIDLEKIKRRNEREIDNLEKLTTIDPELLKKYSKVYFLSENYDPPKLADINIEYVIRPERELQILKDVEPFLQEMLEAAKDDKIDLRVISAYRSFETQTQLKSQYTVTYGSGANQFSADQGYSEHQLGTTLDFGTPEITGAYTSFENSTAFKWLVDNAHDYGFVLSYPKGNTYYTYEPWHWRFVGTRLAGDLKDDNMHLYQMDQREIDKYLLRIFD